MGPGHMGGELHGTGMPGYFSKNMIITIIAGIVLATLFPAVGEKIIRDRAEKTFLYEAGGIRDRVLTSLNASRAVSHSMRALFRSAEFVDADQFRVFSEEIFSRYAFIKAMTYYPRVFHWEREAFTRSLRERGFVSYEIHQHDHKQGRIPAPMRKRYFPVLYREPFSPEAAMLFGFDILTRPSFTTPIHKSFATGLPAPSGPFTSEDGSGNYELFIAVYEGKQVPDSDWKREERVNGLLSFTIAPGTILSGRSFSKELSIGIFSPETGAAPRNTRFSFLSPPRKSSRKSIFTRRFSREFRVEVNEQCLGLSVEKTIDYKPAELGLLMLALLPALLITPALHFFLEGRTRRLLAELEVRRLNAELETRVARRTRELNESIETLKQTKDQLVMSEKMAALGGLVAGVAHEINTPVGIGITDASFLNDRAAHFMGLYREGRLTRSEFEKFLDLCMEISTSILTNLQRAGALVNSFKQVAVDQSSEELRRFDLGKYLDEILLSLHSRLRKGNHRVIVECPDELMIESYPGAIAQVITNFVMNTLQHGFEGRFNGEIRITVSAGDGELTLCYLDNGRGMTDEIREQIFDPFFTTRRGQGGSGLGLHIVYNLIVQTLGGQVRCESSPGKGTAFFLRLPLKRNSDRDNRHLFHTG